MSLELKIDEDFIFPSLDVATKEEAISFLADQLFSNGLVDEGYKEAILTRESVYPTGLPANGYNIAIPHADYTLVKETALAIGILKNPVTFKAMDDVTKDVAIHIIIMLAIHEPHGQIEMLQRIVGIIQNENLRKALVESADKSQSIKQLISYLKGEL
ncbi:PTS system galactitol-specific IIA component [Streptococcus rupicaprae]|uniref:PTS system galactitol-specific IIA component n=1 Tax=Streptococcus rupicaprae TaxID=759619 RepID=A0ABV2FKF3_9STRE